MCDYTKELPTGRLWFGAGKLSGKIIELSPVEVVGPRQEILNFRNKDDFEMFFKLTNDSEELKNSFNDENEDIETASKKWLKNFKLILKASFSKLRDEFKKKR